MLPTPKSNFNPHLPPDLKINSKCIINPNVKSKAMNLLEENMGKIFCGLGLDKNFLDATQKHDP